MSARRMLPNGRGWLEVVGDNAPPKAKTAKWGPLVPIYGPDGELYGYERRMIERDDDQRGAS